MTREEAIRIIETVFQDEYVYKYYDSITHQALNMAIEALQTLEAVERIKTEVLPQTDLVRCKDCRHAYFKDFDKYCRRMVGALKPNQFCSFGELSEKVECSKCKHKETCEDAYTENSQYCNGERAEQTEYKLPGHDEVMEALDKMTLKPKKENEENV